MSSDESVYEAVGSATKAPSFDEKQAKRLLSGKLKFLDSRRGTTGALSDAEKQHLTSSCVETISSSLDEINLLSKHIEQLKSEKHKLEENQADLEEQLELEKELTSNNHSIIAARDSEISQITNNIQAYRKTRDALQKEINELKDELNQKEQKVLELEKELQKALSQTKLLQKELEIAKNNFETEQVQNIADREKFNAKYLALKEKLSDKQKEYNSILEEHQAGIKSLHSKFNKEQRKLHKESLERLDLEVNSVREEASLEINRNKQESELETEALHREIEHLNQQLQTLQNRLQPDEAHLEILKPEEDIEDDSSQEQILDEDKDSQKTGSETGDELVLELESEDEPEGEIEDDQDQMAQNNQQPRMDLLKYIPRFCGDSKDSETATEHVKAFHEYLDIHQIPRAGNQADYQQIYTRFGYSLKGNAKAWYLDWTTRDQANAYDQNKYDRLIADFQAQFSRFGSTKIEKDSAFQKLTWDPKLESLDAFVRKLKELGTELGKQDEDLRNGLVKAIPSSLVPAIASLNNLDDMVSTIKRMFGFLQLNPSIGIPPNLQTFVANPDHKVDFHMGNMITHQLERVGEKLESIDRFGSKLRKMEDEIYSLREGMENLQMRPRNQSQDRKSRNRIRNRGRYRSSSRSHSRGQSPFSAQGRMLEEVYYMLRTDRDKSRSFRGRGRSNDRRLSFEDNNRGRDNRWHRYRDQSRERYSRDDRNGYRPDSRDRFRSSSRDRFQNRIGQNDQRDRQNSERCQFCDKVGHQAKTCYKLLNALDRMKSTQERAADTGDSLKQAEVNPVVLEQILNQSQQNF